MKWFDSAMVLVSIVVVISLLWAAFGGVPRCAEGLEYAEPAKVEDSVIFVDDKPGIPAHTIPYKRTIPAHVDRVCVAYK